MNTLVGRAGGAWGVAVDPASGASVEAAWGGPTGTVGLLGADSWVGAGAGLGGGVVSASGIGARLTGG